MNAAEILDAARGAGLHLAVVGSDLVFEASNSPPAAFLDLIRVHKVEIIVAITAAKDVSHETDDDVVDWRDWYEERVAIRQFDGGYTREEAERLAWGEAQDRWHRACGERVPRHLCAGCRHRIGYGQKALDLADGNRVHFGDLECLIRHGGRWRGAAAQALIAFGPPKP
jgi:hypothetical protein